MSNTDKVNNQLADVLEIWYEGVCKNWQKDETNHDNLKKWIKKHYKNGEEEKDISFTEPFCTAVLDDYDSNKKTLMFVGQETNGYGDINNFNGDVKNSIINSQQWLKEFLAYNLKQIKPNENKTYSLSKQEIPYKKNAFIKAIRELSKDYNICWNNIDKIQYRTNNIKGIKLYVEDEEYLNGRINNSNTLLLQEINIVKPDIIVFAIGTSYKISLETSITKKLNNGYIPNNNKPIGECFYINNIPCVWTYHPRYYKFDTNCLGKVIRDILQNIK